MPIPSTTRTEQPPLRLHKAAHDPRAAALVTLSTILSSNVNSQAALDEALASPAMVPTDKRLCTEIVYGVLRSYLRLREFRDAFLKKPEKLPEEMRLAMLLAVYEMLFLRIPHYASVNWAVGHIRNRFGQGLARVANGALRAMQRNLKTFAAVPETPLSKEAKLARDYAIPAWIVRLWLESYGNERTLALLGASLQAPPSGLRLNRACPDWERLRTDLLEETQAPISALRHAAPALRETEEVHEDHEGKGQPRPLSVGPCSLAFPGPLPWQARELLEKGRASRQSAASCEVLEALEPASWPLPLWDCCAGRGGKSLALLEQGIAVALASDQSRQRLQALPVAYAHLGLHAPPCPDILPLPVDKAVEELATRLFGTILIDAPCSGLGTLSRRPEIRLRRSPEDLVTLTGIQKGILAATWDCLQSGGSLIYITCTLNPAENQDQVRAFLTEHPDAALVKEFQTPFSSPLQEFFYGARIVKA